MKKNVPFYVTGNSSKFPVSCIIDRFLFEQISIILLNHE